MIYIGYRPALHRHGIGGPFFLLVYSAYPAGQSNFSGERATFFFSSARNFFSGGGQPASA